MQTLKLGTVACLHGNLKVAKRLVDVFRKEHIDALALIGDIPSDENQKNNLISILKVFEKLDKPIFVLPGSHEHYDDYSGAIKKFTKNKNIIDCSRICKHNFNGYDLVFLPGSDVSTKGSGFKIMKDKKQIKRFRRIVKQYPNVFTGKVIPVFVSDSTKITDKNSIFITHIPPKFSTKNAIDVAEFGKPTKDFSIKKKHEKILNHNAKERIDTTSVFPLSEAKKYFKLGYPIKLHKKNVGNEHITKLIRKSHLSKYICGHIHEAGGKASTLKGKSVKENSWSKELFYNCSPGKLGKAGIIEFQNNIARFINIKVKYE